MGDWGRNAQQPAQLGDRVELHHLFGLARILGYVLHYFDIGITVGSIDSNFVQHHLSLDLLQVIHRLSPVNCNWKGRTAVGCDAGYVL